ncbi:SMC family ATPase [Streptomyces luteoverticillatus]|uniref:Nuclease SbcCD subunit C n=1 Tax=Streptomyces luteoverticillatus TaxID=66425 RepID=A0A3S9PQD8_STRLT|nr:SMC family ATPase [Streptomyces luteoverticillatus]AZQ74632.1 SMC family ATPase [Streptomyces luteoverticillatus]
MRLHRLTLTAFGPFGGTEHIDFDELAGAGLFLLHGPTGAGKTSVLDAVCFALYGGVPGARQGAGLTLRSDHADPATPTEVVLELTAGERRLEITRRPEQPRPKKRGTGFTREKAYSALRELPAGATEWKALSRSHDEIGEEITRLLGMSREQFCQVVLLPQGDFARFLRAEDGARARLLGRLFDTGRFAAAEEHLAELRRAAEARVRAGDERLLALGHRMRQAAADPSLPEVGTPHPATVPDARRPAPRRGAPAPAIASDGAALPEEAGGRSAPASRRAGRVPGPRSGAEAVLTPGDAGLAEAVLEWAALARTHARERRDIADTAARAAERGHQLARQRADEARDLERLQRRHADALRRAAALAEGRDERDAVRERLARGRAAEVVAPALEARDRAEAAHRAAAQAEHRARTPLPAERREAGAEELSALEHALREELGSLAAARRAEDRAAAIAAETTGLERAADADEALLAEAADWLTGWDATRRDHQRRVDAAQEAAAQAERLATRLETERQRLAAARRRDALAHDVSAAEARLLRAREEAVAAHEHWLDLKERRLRGIAAELAAGLEPGAPCAVCGATEHPDPARAAAGQVDRATEETALAASRRANDARDAADLALRPLREELAVAGADAGEATVAELTALVDDLARAHAGARAAAEDLHRARQALESAEREHERRRAGQEEARLRLAAHATRRDSLDAELRALTEELDRARGGAESVAHRAALLERRLGLVAAAAEAARETARTADRLKEADDRLADAAYRAGFDTPAQAAAALLSTAARRELEQREEAWRREEAAVAAELADPGPAEAAALPPAAPEAAHAAADAATRLLRHASAEEAAARTRCDELDRLSAEAVADARRLAPLRAEYHRVAELASLAAGTSARNERKMRLESYVLAARLEQVAAAATVRLRRMSGGRYTLVHSDARTSGRGRSGLGLHVVDAWTGSERDTATLSGGETFFASLALALGLADVVTEEAGGVRLDTLFIDEGFGSLDEQTLDEVLDVLDSLRERDRTVGIVSHVADLRQRVPAQLHVVKDRSGSAVRPRTAPLPG